MAVVLCIFHWCEEPGTLRRDQKAFHPEPVVLKVWYPRPILMWSVGLSSPFLRVAQLSITAVLREYFNQGAISR